MQGQPRVVVLPGEPGIGKTRFLRQVESTSGDTLCFHYSRCREEMSLPYFPFIEGILGPIVEALGDLDGALGEDAEPIRQLLRQQRPEGLGAVRAPTERDRYRLFAAVSHAVIAEAQTRPTVLVFDDLHWADRPSLDLLRHLVFAAADAAERESVALMIVGAYRPVAAEHPLDGVLASLHGEQICQTLVLPEFDEADTADLIQSLHLGRPSGQLVATVVEATGGNPLFAEEALRQLMREGAVQERGGELVTTASAQDVRFPEHVAGAIAARMQGLSEGCRSALSVAALLGGSFTTEVVARISGEDAAGIESFFGEAEAQGLLRREDGALRFAHPLVQHVSFAAPHAEQRSQRHRRVAEVLEALSAADGRDRCFEIAHHLVAAGDAADPVRAVAGVRLAADRAFAMYAWGEAARYYEIAASAAQQSDQVSLAERAELHYRTAYSHHRDRHPGPCLAHYDLAVEAYRAIGDLHGVAQTLADLTRAQFELVPVPYGTLIDVQPLEEAVSALGESEPQLRGRIWETIGEVYWTARQPEKARSMSELAVRIGVETDDAQLCAYARLGMALAQLQQLDLRAALERYEAAQVDAARAQDPWLEAQALQRRPLVLTWMGRLDEAEAAATESTEFSRRLQDWSGCSLSSTTSNAVALARGAFAAVEQHAGEGMRMLRRSSYPWGALLFLPALAAARALRGEWAAAEDAITLLEEPGRVFPEPGASVRFVSWVYRQLIALYADRLEVAHAAQFAQTVQSVLRDAGSDINTIVCACALVEIGAAGGEIAIVAAAAASLNEAAAREAVLCNSWSFLVPRVCGVAATLGRRWDDAEERFDEAIRLAESQGMRPELGRSYLDSARMVVARGAGDRAGAIDRLQRAAAIFHELDMSPFLRQAASLAKLLQTPLP
ncbi:MAG: AAA family ATPase, partial [Ardenticatenales bacterium]